MHNISVSSHYQAFALALFTKTVEIHGYKTSSSNLGNFYINISKTNQRLRSFNRLGAKFGIVSPLQYANIQIKPSRNMRAFTLKHLVSSWELKKRGENCTCC